MTIARINLLITFDYELFLGRNFLPDEEVLFEPARLLEATCRRLGVRSTFFADVCSVWTHREQGGDGYADQFEEQLKAFLVLGHDVQLHIHPHWLRARREGGNWRIDPSKMYLFEFGFGPEADAAPAVIARGVRYLEQLLSPLDVSYRCVAFRAAGLALEPQASALFRALLDSGICIDTSVAKGVKTQHDGLVIDYTGAPKAPNWFIHPESGINTAASNGIFEIPVGTFQLRARARASFLVKRLLSARKLRGAGISRAARQTRLANLISLLRANLRYLYKTPCFVLSCDTKGFDLKMLSDGFQAQIESHADTGPVYLSLLCHPKLMFPKEIDLLEGLVTTLRKRYGTDLAFPTCREVAGTLPAGHRTA